MIIGTTKELKNHEYRVGLTPDNAAAFIIRGHKVYVETHAGEGAGFSDEAYRNAGCIVVDTSAEVFAERRETSVQELLNELKKNPVDIELYLGCEVLYFEELWRVESLKDFAIRGTEYILSVQILFPICRMKISIYLR